MTVYTIDEKIVKRGMGMEAQKYHLKVPVTKEAYQGMVNALKQISPGDSFSYKPLLHNMFQSIKSNDSRNCSDDDYVKAILLVIEGGIQDTLNELRKMSTWKEGWNGSHSHAPNYHSLKRATELIILLFLEVLTLDKIWIKPVATLSSNGDVILGWRHGFKYLTLYVREHSIEYIRAWDLEIDPEMDAGDVDQASKRQFLWNWLVTEELKKENEG